MLLGLSGVFAIFWTIKTKKIFPAIITLGMIVGIALVLFPSMAMQTPGFYIYMGFVALTIVYAFVVPDLKIDARIIIGLMSASIFLYWLWVLNHWHGNVVLIPIFTLVVGAFGVFRKVKVKNELGFLIILAADAVAIILENWMKTT